MPRRGHAFFHTSIDKSKISSAWRSRLLCPRACSSFAIFSQGMRLFHNGQKRSESQNHFCRRTNLASETWWHYPEVGDQKSIRIEGDRKRGTLQTASLPFRTDGEFCRNWCCFGCRFWHSNAGCLLGAFRDLVLTSFRLAPRTSVRNLPGGGKNGLVRCDQGPGRACLGNREIGTNSVPFSSLIILFSSANMVWGRIFAKLHASVTFESRSGRNRQLYSLNGVGGYHDAV